jgi:hypothetical protein
MAFNVNTFRNQFTGDGARPNLFEVLIPDIAGPKLTFTCKAAQLPASTVGVIDVPYFGRQIKLAGNRTFADWTITILNDEDFEVRDALEERMSLINSHAGNESELFGSYSFDAIVNQYGKTGDIIKTYNFVGMFPTEIGAIDLDWGSNDTIEEYTVTFAYQYWTSNTTDAD